MTLHERCCKPRSSLVVLGSIVFALYQFGCRTSPAGEPSMLTKPLPEQMSDRESLFSITDAERKVTLMFLRRPPKPTGTLEIGDWPIEVWRVPLADNGAHSWDKAALVALIPQAHHTEPGLVVCLAGKRVLCLYKTLWDSGVYLSFREFSLSDTYPWPDATEAVSKDGKRRELPSRLPTRGDATLGGGDLLVKMPLSIALGLKGEIVATGVDRKGRAFSMVSVDDGKSWGTATRADNRIEIEGNLNP
jgi:hypothetical protein